MIGSGSMSSSGLVTTQESGLAWFESHCPVLGPPKLNPDQIDMIIRLSLERQK